MKKRDVFTEVMQGIEEIGLQRENKITLKQVTLEHRPVPEFTAKELITLRQHMNLSQEVFAYMIRTKPETLRNWEREKCRPNAQASLLLRLIERHPDILEKLAAV